MDPESAILVENKSKTTFETAEYSLKIVQNQGYKSVIVVTSQYHKRRASIIFTHFFKGINLTICPVPYIPQWRTIGGNMGIREILLLKNI